MKCIMIRSMLVSPSFIHISNLDFSRVYKISENAHVPPLSLSYFVRNGAGQPVDWLQDGPGYACSCCRCRWYPSTGRECAFASAVPCPTTATKLALTPMRTVIHARRSKPRTKHRIESVHKRYTQIYIRTRCGEIQEGRKDFFTRWDFHRLNSTGVPHRNDYARYK
eukprot:1372213-Amorphochlora_amoeboformis.AAC.1